MLFTSVFGLKSLLRGLNASWLSAPFPCWLYGSRDFVVISFFYAHVPTCSSRSATKPLSISKYVRVPELRKEAAVIAGFWFCEDVSGVAELSEMVTPCTASFAARSS